jgi:hypothetical protein
MNSAEVVKNILHIVTERKENPSLVEGRASEINRI